MQFTLITNGQTAEEFNINGLKKHEVNDYEGAIKDFNKAIFKNYRIAECDRSTEEGMVGDPPRKF